MEYLKMASQSNSENQTKEQLMIENEFLKKKAAQAWEQMNNLMKQQNQTK